MALNYKAYVTGGFCKKMIAILDVISGLTYIS